MASDNTISAPTPRASVFEPGTKHSFYGSFPRELRDKIYDQIISEKEEVFKSACCKMRSTVPKVRLLCKQFKQEYDERCPKLNHLQIFSCYIRCPKTYWSPDPTPIPPLGIQATSLQYHTIWCEHKLGSGEPCKKDIRTDMLWKNIGRQLGEYIEDFPHLAEFNLIISCSSLTCARAVVASDGASRSWGWISGQPRVSLLMPVYDSRTSKKSLRESDDNWGADYPHPGPFFEDRETMATWSYKEGWKADEEVIEKCRQEEARWLSSRPQEGKTPSWSSSFKANTDTFQSHQSHPKTTAILKLVTIPVGAG